MSLTVFLAVLFAAVLHATWNAVVKLGTDRFRSMLMLTITQGLIGIVLIFVFPLPAAAAWPWILASGLIHSIYKVFLTTAYNHGDLSRVYPIARGAAPIMVALFALAFLNEDLRSLEYFGITAVGFGIMLMAHGVWTSGEARALVPLALLSALSTAAYSVVDGLGARLSGTASGYTGWIFLVDAIFLTSWSVARRGLIVIPLEPRLWAIGGIAGGLSLSAYWIVVWAMTVAPIALVTALRETSVLFALLIGILWMREKAGAGKIIAGALIVAGVVLTRAA